MDEGRKRVLLIAARILAARGWRSGMEAAQAKYAPLLLKRTCIAIYDGKVPVAEWLESL